MFSYSIPNVQYQVYKLILKAENQSYYEFMLTQNDSDIAISKILKLFEGYHEMGPIQSQSQKMIKDSVADIAQRYIRTNLPPQISRNGNLVFENVLVKDLPNIGTYYKIVVSPPLEQSIVVFGSNGIFTSNGYDKIPNCYSRMKSIGKEKPLGIFGDIISKLSNPSSTPPPPPLPPPKQTFVYPSANPFLLPAQLPMPSIQKSMFVQASPTMFISPLSSPFLARNFDFEMDFKQPIMLPPNLRAMQ
jgi:hypothetical protein